MEKIEELRAKYKKLEERIKQLESDLRSPLSQDPDEDAVETKNRDILYGLYQVEKKNLVKLEAEIRQASQ